MVASDYDTMEKTDTLLSDNDKKKQDNSRTKEAEEDVPTRWIWFPHNWLDGLLLVGTIFYGMNAGLFFIFDICIMPSLATVSDAEGIAVMQQINVTIQSPLFFLVFMGAFVIAIINMVILLRHHRVNSTCTYFKYTMTSSLFYILGCMLVTVVVHVPRNDALGAMDAESSDASTYWRNEYLTVWVAWNHVRTITCLMATVFAIIAFRVRVGA